MKTKRIFTIIATAVLTISVSAQRSDHNNYVGIYVGGGLNTMLYQPVNGQSNMGYGYDAGVQYSHFFNQMVGIGVGAQLSFANAKAKYNWSEVTPGLIHPSNPNQPYNLITSFNNWTENQNLGVASIPVELLLRKVINDRAAFIFGVGASLDLPLYGNYARTEGTYSTTGVFPGLGNYEVKDLPEHGFDTYATTGGAEMKNLASVGASVLTDLGFRVALGNVCGMYFGLYAAYGFTNLIGQAKSDPLLVINSGNQIEYHGTFASNETSKANLLRAGIKIAVNFGWPRKVEEAEPVEELPTIDEEAERLAREQAERDSIAAAEAEAARLAAERAEAARLAAQKAEEERVAAEQAKAEEQQKKRFAIEAINVYFENGGTEPAIGEEEKVLIEELCEIMKTDNTVKVVVYGHTDNYGDPEQNLRYYGLKRAEALKNYMVNKGVPAEQIRCESKGQTEPIVPNDTRANRAINRRANIRFE